MSSVIYGVHVLYPDKHSTNGENTIIKKASYFIIFTVVFKGFVAK